MSRNRDDRRADPPNLIEMLRQQAQNQPGRHAFTFLADGDSGDEVQLTYGELDRRARNLAGRLQGLGLAGERALLLYPPGLEFLTAFFGCLYAGVVAVPAHLPRPNRPMVRLGSIIADARPKAVLTSNNHMSDVPRWGAATPTLAECHTLATDAENGPEALWQAPEVDRSTLAFLQYTSGSTAAPKGVMISHGNLLHNSALIRAAFDSTADSRGVFWLPLFHDMGLIGGILQTLFCGGSSTLLSPVAFLQRPLRWLQAISRTGATISGGPNFAYELCVRKIGPEQRTDLDLSRWRVAFNGAEPIHPKTLARFVEAFAPSGFRREAFLPCYGLAEATLLVSGGPPLTSPSVLTASREDLGRDRIVPADPQTSRTCMLVGSGQVAADQDVVIVDPECRARRAADQVGEIWVKGPSVARGYWERPEETERTFHATLADTGEGPFLRTGDLGFLRDGELTVTGRLKDLIIVRGRNVYPQDVEWTVAQSHALLRPEGGAAFSVEVGGEERLVIVYEVERLGKKVDPDDVMAAIRRAVAEQHELDVYAVRLIRALSLPKTSSGKVQRHACRNGFLAETLDVVGAWTQAVEERVPSLIGSSPIEEIPQTSRPSSRAIADWLATKVADPLGLRADEIDRRSPFANFGLGSLQAVRLAGELEEWLGRPLSPTLVYDHPNIAALAEFLADGSDTLATTVTRQGDRPGDAELIAIIGIGCRVPGASGPDAFWRLVRDGVEAVGQVPEDRWNAEQRAASPERGGFLERVDQFDADFFGISPREAVRMDPQQRLLLEVAWEALEDAGQVPERLAGKPVGVFIGIATDDYSRIPGSEAQAGDAYTLTGGAASIAANRLSYALDLRGPSLAIDTACSSSLVAAYLACKSLRDGESELALAGGVNLILAPEVSANFAEGGFLAPDGRCKAFDARADGYVRGEGAGIVVLKPLSRALADGDPVYALIRGGAVNQDGRSNGLTAPNRLAQEAVLRAAYRRAGVSPGQVQYIEAHGTGTLLGDPIEANALGTVLTEGRAPGTPCALGSVKTNIGHLEAAAGAVGLIKTALALHHREIPPSLHFHEANPHIPFDVLPLRVATERTVWPESVNPPLAGVSSFGFGGTNAHMVLEGIPQPTNPQTGHNPSRGQKSVLLPLSARSPEALRDLARSWRVDLAGRLRDVPLSDVGYSASNRRGHHDHRLAVVVDDADSAAASLDAYLSGEDHPGLSVGRKPRGRAPGLVFVFSGQGGSWWGVGRELLEYEPVARVVFEECDAWFRREASWSLWDELNAEQPESRLARTEFAQPVQFALQVALAALWGSWGIVPDTVIGHSLGEIAAAHVAGVLNLNDALRVVHHRSRLMGSVAGQGGTAVIGLGADEVRRRLDAEGLNDRLSIATVNSPDSTAISGDAGALAAFVQGFETEGVFARVLNVDCAFHGPLMDTVKGDLASSLQGLKPAMARIPLISTVTGQPVDGPGLDAEYWARNLRQPVLFSAAVEALDEGAHEVFVEVGPHPVLSGAIASCLRRQQRSATVLPSLRRGQDDRRTMLESLGTLYALGFAIDWGQVYQVGNCVRLPSYPWRRERFWLDAVDSPPASRNGRAGVPSNGLPAVAVRAPETNPNRLIHEVRWQPASLTNEALDATHSRNGRTGHWLIFSDAGGVGDALRDRLEARGDDCILISASSGAPSTNRVVDPASPADVDELIRETLEPSRGRCRGVVYLWSLDCSVTDQGTSSDLESAQRIACGGVLSLAKGLADVGGNRLPRLWVVTRGAQSTDPTTNSRLTTAQATLWGLGRSFALEYPEFWGGLIDLDPEADSRSNEAAALATTIINAGRENQIALRQGRCLVSRLVRNPALADSPTSLTLRPDGTYLITGGLGDLGLRVARRLVEQGARRLVLLSRSGLPSREAWRSLPEDDPARIRVEAVQALEQLGATIVTPAVDVADEAGMAALFADLRRNWPSVRGVVHVAGVVRDRSDRSLELDGLLSLFRPKVQGTWILHQLTLGLPLDFFVLFSSVSSVLGSRGQADYAAANAFLDALAHDRAAQGLTAQSINWGPWGGDGMAAASGWLRSLQLMGLKPLDPERGLDALNRLCGSSARQVTILDADWSTVKALHAEERGGSFLDEIEIQAAEIAGKGQADLRALSVEERRARILELLRNRVADVLRMPADRVDPDRPLDTLGLDSLMAMELKAGIEADLGVVLPLSSFLEGPSIAGLAERALADLAGPSAQPSASLAASLEHVAESPLSLGQQSLWSAHQVAPQGAAYNISGAARVRAKLDHNAFRTSLRRLVERHESLRTVFATVNDRPVLRVLDHSEIALKIEDASAWNDLDLQTRLVEESRRPFDLERGPLVRVVVYRVSDCESVLQLIIHHIITDFWSIAVLMDEFGRFYASERSGVATTLGPIELQYTDVVRWQGDLVAGEEGDRLWNYWQRQLAGPLPELALPTDRPRPPVWSYRGARRSVTLDAGLSQGISALGDRLGASPYVTLLAAFQVLLSRFSGQNNVIVGSPVSGRTRPGLEDLTGYVINLVPMRANLAGNPTFEQFLGQVRQTVRDGLEHQDFPFALAIQRLHPDRDPSRTPVFQAMFIYQKAHRLDDQGLTPFALSTAGPTMVLGGLPMESMTLDKGTALFDLTLTAAPVDGLLRFSLEFNTDLFDSSTIDRLLGHFQTLLAGIVARSDSGVADFALLSMPEQRQLLEDWSGPPARSTDDVEAIHQRFEAHARRSPDAVALIHGDQSLTYEALNEQANRLAHYLRGLDVGPDVLVGLCVGRSAEMMVGVLGILKAGGAYVPLDPEYPRDRLEFMIRDAGLSILLTEKRLRADLPEHNARVVCFDSDRDAIAAQPFENLSTPTNSTSLAYVIYTSGSTGKPKGVMVGHASLVNAFDAWSEAYGLNPGARHLQAAGFAFDVFTGDWTRALCSGGVLVSCPRELLLDPDALHDFIDRERIEFSELVPVVAETLIRSVEAKGGKLNTLSLIAVGSDQWRAGQHQRLRALVGPSARVVNSYGLTEATIDSTYFEGGLDGIAADRSVPIGRPFSGSKVYVLDDRLNPAPIGVPGELCVGGVGLARGYLGRPGLTAERFVPDPFSDQPGARLYRTGDLARWRADGLLELVGRSDHQVKVRGFRIELGEVEAVLSRHPAVQSAAVVARALPSGEARLAGYVVLVEGASSEPSDVRRWLKERLPDYMVPASLTVLDVLPLSPNGKVDRQALAALAPAAVETVEEATAARGPTEALLARLAAEVLGVKQVGVFDNFFELGIDSILIIQIVSRGRQAGLRLDPGQLFQHQSIAALAQAIDNDRTELDATTTEPIAPGALLPRRDWEKLAGDGQTVEDAYPLSPVQQGMLYHTMATPRSGVYIEQFTCLLRGELDLDAFEGSWKRLLARHPALRTCIEEVHSDRPAQVVRRSVELPLEHQDWRGESLSTQKERLAAFLKADRIRGFDLTEPPLLRLALLREADDAARLVWSHHHIVMDGWCMPVLMMEFLELYDAERAGTEPNLPVRRPYRDYIAWLQDQHFEQAEAFWRLNLAGIRAPTPLGIDREDLSRRGDEPSPHDERQMFLSAEVTDGLRALARANQVTLNTTVQGAWAVLLSRYSGRNEVVFGVASAGRPSDLADSDEMIGLFINTLPMRVAVPDEAELAPWLRQFQAGQADLRRLEATPLVQIQGWSEVPRGQPLFESLFIFENFPVDAALAGRAGRLGIEAVRFLDQTNYPLNIMAVPGEQLFIKVGYDPRRFDADAIERLLAHLRTLLEGMAAGPDRRLADLPVLSELEQRQLLEHWNAPDLNHSPHPEQNGGPAGLDLDGLAAEDLDAWIEHLQRSIGETGDEPYAR